MVICQSLRTFLAEGMQSQYRMILYQLAVHAFCLLFNVANIYTQYFSQ